MSDPLPPSPDPTPTPPPTHARITCEFCESSLAPSGQAFRLSPRAIVLRDQEDEIRKLRESLAQAEGASETIKRDLQAAQAEIARLMAPAGAGPKSPGWS